MIGEYSNLKKNHNECVDFVGEETDGIKNIRKWFRNGVFTNSKLYFKLRNESLNF